MRAIAAAQDETLRLVRARHRAGLATPFDVERAQTDAARSHAEIPPLETLAAVSRNRIAVLIGDQAFNAASIVASTRRHRRAVRAAWATGGAAAAPAGPAGLERRSSTRRTARRQQAEAEWFPRLFLGAVFGQQGIEMNAFNLGATRFNNAAALLAMPIFNAGRTQAINDIAESGQSEAVLRYEDGIVRALEDVENALVALGDRTPARANVAADAPPPRPMRRWAARNRSTTAARSTCCRCSMRSARASPRASAPTTADTRLLLDSVQLYKALGGGWQVFEPAAQATVPSPAVAGAVRRFPENPYLSRGTALKTLIPRSAPWPQPPCSARAARTSPRRRRPGRCAPPNSATTQAGETNRYAGTVQSRHEVEQAFRVGGKVVQRKVDVGQFVHEGDVLAVLDDADYRLAEEAARQQYAAAVGAGAPGRLGPQAAGRA